MYVYIYINTYTEHVHIYRAVGFQTMKHGTSPANIVRVLGKTMFLVKDRGFINKLVSTQQTRTLSVLSISIVSVLCHFDRNGGIRGIFDDAHEIEQER